MTGESGAYDVSDIHFIYPMTDCTLVAFMDGQVFYSDLCSHQAGDVGDQTALSGGRAVTGERDASVVCAGCGEDLTTEHPDDLVTWDGRVYCQVGCSVRHERRLPSTAPSAGDQQ